MSISTAHSLSNMSPSDTVLENSFPIPVSTSKREFSTERTARYAPPLTKVDGNLMKTQLESPTTTTTNNDEKSNSVEHKSGSGTPTQLTYKTFPPTLSQSSSGLSLQSTEIDAEDAQSLLLLRENTTPPSSMPLSAQGRDESRNVVVIPENPRVQTPKPDVVMTSPVATTPITPLVGNKRTASGIMKASDLSATSSPYISGDPNSPSLNVDKSKITELSAQLRTRLSYAMMKVQHGWAAHSLDQVETIYSNQKNTPTLSSGQFQQELENTPNLMLKREYSTDSTHEPMLISPQEDIKHFMSPKLSRDDYRSHARTSSDTNIPFHNTFMTDNALGVSIPNQNNKNNRTYESFWQSHAVNPHTAKILASRTTMNPSATSPIKHLAPAAPIMSHRGAPKAPPLHDSNLSRRKKLPPPPLPHLVSSISNMSNVSTSSTVILTDESYQEDGPLTPTRTTTFTMEQDAVESLMFLSSPGHSQATAPSSQNNSRPVSRSHPVLQHRPSSTLVRSIWAGADDDGDSFMGDITTSTQGTTAEEDDLDRELDNIPSQVDYKREDEDDLNLSSYERTPGRYANHIKSRDMNQGRLKRVKTMEDVIGMARGDSVVLAE